MKRSIAAICCILLVTSLPSSLYSWGSITHTYLIDKIGYRWGYLNHQEIYGATLPDMFNLMYGSPYRDYLWTQTHIEFTKLTDLDGCRAIRAFFYGVGSHNDVWAADYTAHHDARTNPGEGYVRSKASVLVPVLKPQLTGVLSGAGVPNADALAEALAPGLAENFIETAVDLLIKRNEDPIAGFKLILASQVRHWRVPLLLVRAYARDFATEFGLSWIEASMILIGAEREYRDLMKLYGGIFIQDENSAIDLLAEQGAFLAEAYLKAATGYDVSVPPVMLATFLRDAAIPCVEPDYALEISATQTYIEEELASRGFGPGSLLFVLDEGEDPVTPRGSRYHLGQNHPNPFNPTTVINYSLAEDSHVSLVVYNVLGQEVAVLIDGHQPAGDHSVTWNAQGLPSGIYFYRMKTDRFTATKKMCLLK